MAWLRLHVFEWGLLVSYIIGSDWVDGLADRLTKQASQLVFPDLQETGLVVAALW